MAERLPSGVGSATEPSSGRPRRPKAFAGAGLARDWRGSGAGRTCPGVPGPACSCRLGLSRPADQVAVRCVANELSPVVRVCTRVRVCVCVCVCVRARESVCVYADTAACDAALILGNAV